MSLLFKFWCAAAVLAFLAVGCNQKISQEIPQPAIKQATPAATATPIAIRDYIATSTSESGNPPQFVVMAFDGSYSLPMWQNTLDFSQSMLAEGHPVHFTYFLSGVYFLNFRKAAIYQPPLKPAGTSLIGFGLSNLDIEQRVAYVNRAILEGHEIGSHANGHFTGAKWSGKDWQQEFSQFNKLIFHIVENNGVSASDASRYTINLEPSDVIGFRAPELGNDASLWPALKDNGFLYDTSLTGKPDAWPKKLFNGLWEFPLASIPYASSTRNLLSMDYNFYFKQSGGKDVTKKGDAKWDQFYNDTYTSYLNYFEKNYQGNRAPVFIGSHFSEWNDGVYWEAMKNFGATVCAKPEVKCVSFKELMEYLNSYSQRK